MGLPRGVPLSYGTIASRVIPSRFSLFHNKKMSSNRKAYGIDPRAAKAAKLFHFCARSSDPRHHALLSCRHEREGGFNSLATPERSADSFFEPADYGVGANSAPPGAGGGGGACAEGGRGRRRTKRWRRGGGGDVGGEGEGMGRGAGAAGAGAGADTTAMDRRRTTIATIAAGGGG